MSARDDLEERLEKLRPGSDVTVIDVTGARFTGSVLRSRPLVDPERELGLRRSTGIPHWIKYDRIVALETDAPGSEASPEGTGRVA